MKLTLATILLSTVVSQAALAETITCTFTEPFLTTTYATETRTFTVYDPFAEQGSAPVVEKNVELKSTGTNSFDLVSSNGQVIQKLVKSGNGSDGMSDIVYPFEVKWEKNPVTGGELFGGCSL